MRREKRSWERGREAATSESSKKNKLTCFLFPFRLTPKHFSKLFFSPTCVNSPLSYVMMMIRLESQKFGDSLSFTINQTPLSEFQLPRSLIFTQCARLRVSSNRNGIEFTRSAARSLIRQFIRCLMPQQHRASFTRSFCLLPFITVSRCSDRKQ